jgi:predicted AAA+ superfamily ATPase
MESLIEKSEFLIRHSPDKFERYLIHNINFEERLIAIKGARGCGKTTMLLQYAKHNLPKNGKALYVSLDDIYFAENKLIDLIKNFKKQGGTHLIIDEVHKYPNWSIEIKNAYDFYKDIKIIFTGSSALQLHKAEADLSRRTAQHTLWGLSFREYLKFAEGIDFSVYTFEDIIKNQIEISTIISDKIKPLQYFYKYLNYGYYPYFKEGKADYHSKLLSTINLIIETDLPAIQNIDYSAGIKLKRLFYILSQLCPYKPNIEKLSSQINITRGTLLLYLEYLNNSHLVNLLKTKMGSFSYLTKPDKVFLNNTNLIYALGENKVDIGTLRETFFYNQLNAVASINYSEVGDFLINNKYIFEVGGETKTFNQIKDVKNSFLAIDNIEIGRKNKIPLWLFGFMY